MDATHGGFARECGPILLSKVKRTDVEEDLRVNIEDFVLPAGSRGSEDALNLPLNLGELGDCVRTP